LKTSLKIVAWVGSPTKMAEKINMAAATGKGIK